MPISEDHKTQKFLLLCLYLENPSVSCTVYIRRVIAESSLSWRVQNDKFYISVNISQLSGTHVFAHVHTHIYTQSHRAYCRRGERAECRWKKYVGEGQMFPPKCKLANTMTKLRLCVFPHRIKIISQPLDYNHIWSIINSLNQLIMFIWVASCTALVSCLYIVIDVLIIDDSNVLWQMQSSCNDFFFSQSIIQIFNWVTTHSPNTQCP